MHAPNELFRRTDAPDDETYFTVTLSGPQLAALTAALDAEGVWDGDGADAEENALDAARVALANAERVR